MRGGNELSLGHQDQMSSRHLVINGGLGEIWESLVSLTTGLELVREKMWPGQDDGLGRVENKVRSHKAGEMKWPKTMSR